jgi:GNAT superfamily N-acetyltransferase
MCPAGVCDAINQIMDTLKVKLGELEAFYQTALFQQFAIKPISPLRMQSYLNNPRANTNDIVLYLRLKGDDLVAFRTILPDAVQVGEQTVKFGWCSGIWVDPKYRGQKISTSLLEDALEDWLGRLMFTNTTPVSEYCNLLTNQFKLLKERTGTRFYLYPHLNRIYEYRENYNKIKFILPFASLSMGVLSFCKSLIFNFSQVKCQYIESDFLDEECERYLKNYPITFFNRKVKEFHWMFRYPWLTQTVSWEEVYPFSYLKSQVAVKVVKVWSEGCFVGFFVYTIIDSRMKIIYYFMEENDLHLLTDRVVAIAQKNKIEYLTLLDSHLASLFKKKKSGFSFSKSYQSNIYTSFDVPGKESQLIFDGDGDNGFT